MFRAAVAAFPASFVPLAWAPAARAQVVTTRTTLPLDDGATASTAGPHLAGGTRWHDLGCRVARALQR